LIRESHGVLSVNAVCDVAKKAWLAALSAPASQERADAGKDATLTRWQKAQMAFGGGTTPEPPVGVASLARALTWALEWIDAVPEDTPLPAMPGFDRDYVNELLARVRATAALDAATAQTTTKENGR
jgi:hypothetical protein